MITRPPLSYFAIGLGRLARRFHPRADDDGAIAFHRLIGETLRRAKALTEQEIKLSSSS